MAFTFQPTVAIDQVILRRNYERGVGCDQVKSSIAHRLEQTSLGRFDVGDAVQDGIEPGRGNGA